MALYLLQPGVQPLGQFDILDSYASLVLGGEVGTLFAAARTNSSSEKAAADALDGYTNATDVKRAAVAPWIRYSTTRPLWLLDEGIAGYGTLFGTLIGQTAGLCTGKGDASTCASTLGPSTLSGSGKVTCWDKPGLYGVSMDAVDGSGDGLVLTNASCDPGAKIDVEGTGDLTLSTASTAMGVTVGRFVEFVTRPFLVTTPPSLVGAAESALGLVFSFHVEG